MVNQWDGNRPRLWFLCRLPCWLFDSRLRMKAVIISNAPCLPEVYLWSLILHIQWRWLKIVSRAHWAFPSWNTWMILAPITRLNIPKTGNRWRVAFWANRCHQGPGQCTGQPTLKGNQWLINPYSWWLNQPLWKICSSHWESFPQGLGWKLKKSLSCHHPGPWIKAGYFLAISTPLKINMEYNHGGLEDHFPF